MSEAEWFGPAYGRRLDSDRDEDVLATLDTQWAATDWVVENARRYFMEASLSDFQALGTLGRRWLHIETQREYLLDESQVLNEPDPTTTGVEYFAVDGYRIMFFRARDFDRVTSRSFTAKSSHARCRTTSSRRLEAYAMSSRSGSTEMTNRERVTTPSTGSAFETSTGGSRLSAFGARSVERPSLPR